MRFEVTVLGSCAAAPKVDRHHSAHVLNVREQFFLIDCGEGTQQQMMRAGISPLKLSAVFITHLHGDHCFGLFPLLSTLSLLGRRTPLRLFAPQPMQELLEGFDRYFNRESPFEIDYTPVDTRIHSLIHQTRTLEVYSIPLRHSIPSCGYLFREKQPSLNIRKACIDRYGLGIAQIAAAKRGEAVRLHTGEVIPNEELTYRPFAPRSYAYCTDTQYSAKAAGLAKGADLLFHEATFADEERAAARRTGHSTASEAARFALRAEAGRLLIGHTSNRYKDPYLLERQARAIFPQTDLAVEGRTYSVAPKFNPEKGM